MDENKKLQDQMRKEKFFNKMKNKHNNTNNHINNQNYNNDSTLINNITPVPKENSPKKETTVREEKFESCNETLLNNNNDKIYTNNGDDDTGNKIENDFDYGRNNSKSSTKINYVDTLKKANKYKYIINIFNVIKKLFLIILTILHCSKYLGLDDRSKFKYNILVIEIITFLINKYLYRKIMNLIKINKIEEDRNNNNNKTEFDLGLNYLIDFLYRLIKRSGPLNYIISFLIFAIDLFFDFSTIFLTNILYFILNEKD